MNKARPYRSRKIPACSRCRARRSRCTIEAFGNACSLCQKDGTQCSAASNTTILNKRSTDEPMSAARRVVNTQSTVDLHIVAPMIARDTRVLEDILPTGDANTPASITPKTQRQEPVYHISIPPRRPSPAHCACSQDLPLKLVREVHPFRDQLVRLYLDELHPCLPVFDTESLNSQLTSSSQLSLTFLVTFEAYTLSYWNLAPSLTQHLKPDQDFAWQAVCSAMDSNLSKGGLLAIICAVLCVGGRPSKGVVHNMTNVARMVTLSHSIGLNHDSSDWQISKAEKRMRWRVWWAVLTHDRWFHFAQGTPPLVNAAQYNVPIPSIELLIDLDKPSSEKTFEQPDQGDHLPAQCYIALCQLTEIVGDILPLVYHVRSGTLNLVDEQLAKSQKRLEAWSSELPRELDLERFGDRARVPGLVNLQLAYLSVQMLLQRLFWHEVSLSEIDHDESLLYRCQSAAESVVHFVVSLKPYELASFWLPYNAQHFTSAVSLLLRCALKTGCGTTRTKCIDAARTLINTLREYRDNHSWDMADHALNQSETILNRVEEALPNLDRTEANETRPEVANPSLNHRTYANPIDTDESNASNHNWYNPLGATSLEDLFPGDTFSLFGDYTLFDHMWSQGEAFN